MFSAGPFRQAPTRPPLVNGISDKLMHHPIFKQPIWLLVIFIAVQPTMLHPLPYAGASMTKGKPLPLAM